MSVVVKKFLAFICLLGSFFIILNGLLVGANISEIAVRVGIWLISIYILFRLANLIATIGIPRNEE